MHNTWSIDIQYLEQLGNDHKVTLCDNNYADNENVEVIQRDDEQYYRNTACSLTKFKRTSSCGEEVSWS